MKVASEILIVKLKHNPAVIEKITYLGLKLVDITNQDHRAIYQACLQCYDAKTQSYIYPFQNLLNPSQKEIWEKCEQVKHEENSELEIKNIIGELKKETRYKYVTTLFLKYQEQIKQDPDEIENLVDEFVAALQKRNDADEWEDSNKVAENYVKEIKSRINGISRLSTPFPTLDHILQGGTARGELLIIASMSNMGKSTLANQFMLHYAARQEKKVAVIGLEMSAEEYFSKTMAIMGRQIEDYHDLSMANQSNPIKYGINSSWEEKAKELADLAPQIYLKTKTLNIDELKKQMLIAVKVHGAEVILLDHLLLVERDDMREPEYQYISRITQMMKNFATEQQILCVAVSQMRRGSDMKKVDMSDMASSAGIERQATTLLVLHMHEREEQDSSSNDSPFSKAVNNKIDYKTDNVRRITVAKARHAQRDRFILTRFYGNDSCFVEIKPDGWDLLKDEMPTTTNFSWKEQDI